MAICHTRFFRFRNHSAAGPSRTGLTEEKGAEFDASQCFHDGGGGTRRVSAPLRPSATLPPPPPPPRPRASNGDARRGSRPRTPPTLSRMNVPADSQALFQCKRPGPCSQQTASGQLSLGTRSKADQRPCDVHVSEDTEYACSHMCACGEILGRHCRADGCMRACLPYARCVSSLCGCVKVSYRPVQGAACMSPICPVWALSTRR